jgi:hypothetical protein
MLKSLLVPTLNMNTVVLCCEEIEGLGEKQLMEGENIDDECEDDPDPRNDEMYDGDALWGE